jgi:cell division protein FtsB
MSLDEGLQRAEELAKEIEETEGYEELIAKLEELERTVKELKTQIETTKKDLDAEP